MSRTKVAAAIFASFLLSACAGSNWYRKDPGTDGARLRIVSVLAGNTNFETSHTLSCTLDPERSGLGWFHPNADGWQAGRRGFDHRVGMPGAGIAAPNMFAEYEIRAEKPFFIWAENVGGGGGGGFVFNGAYVSEDIESISAAGFTPMAGHDYEITYARGAQGRELHLFELIEGDRRPLNFDAGVTNCKHA